MKAVVEPVSEKGPRSMIIQLYSDRQTWKRSLSNLALPPVQVKVLKERLAIFIVADTFSLNKVVQCLVKKKAFSIDCCAVDNH